MITIEIEKAETSEEQEIGLMYRRDMQANQGMLFISKEEEEKGFRMKNTDISLDIIYVNAAKEIVSIGKYAQPQPTETILSGVTTQYEAAVEAGLCEEHGMIGKASGWGS